MSNPVHQAIGSVEGRIQSLPICGSLRFTLVDTWHNHDVSCYISEGQEEQVRDIWGNRAVVTGLITRESETGKPVAIREITEIKCLPEVERGGYLRARGISPLKPGDPMPEETIRRLRDA